MLEELWLNSLPCWVCTRNDAIESHEQRYCRLSRRLVSIPYAAVTQNPAGHVEILAMKLCTVVKKVGLGARSFPLWVSVTKILEPRIEGAYIPFN